MHPTYQERVLDSPEVCNNCFRVVRVERIDPTRGGLFRAYESHYERERRTTTIEYAPAETASASKGVFCTCGVESAFDRVWGDADIDRDRFQAFLHALDATLDRQGVAPDASDPARRRWRTRLSEYAIQHRVDGATVDEALSAGVAAGLSSRTRADPARAD